MRHSDRRFAGVRIVRPECRYPNKRLYATRAAAREGARNIKCVVEGRGDRYQTLYPYQCPGLPHWHLSHYQQGKRDCPVCAQRVTAWNGGEVWVIGAHEDLSENRCPGEGRHAGTMEIAHGEI